MANYGERKPIYTVHVYDGYCRVYRDGQSAWSCGCGDVTGASVQCDQIIIQRGRATQVMTLEGHHINQF